MALDLFINFDGNCREAVNFYAKVFKSPEPQFMTFGETPGGGFDERDRDKIMYTFLPIYGCNMMFSDCPSDMRFIRGNSLGISIGEADRDEVKRLYDALSEGGEIHMPLGKTFFSELYGMVTDQYGVLWHVSLTESHS